MQGFLVQSSRSFLLATVLFIGCKNKQEVIYPTMEKITASIYASGTVLSKGQYEVYSKVNAQIEKIAVKEGDFVKAGQPIIYLSNKPQRLGFENAKLLANYASEAQNQEKLNQAQNELALAKLKMENDASLLARQQKLWDSEIGTQNDLDQRSLAFKNSSTLYKASQLKLNDLQKQIKLQAQQSNKSAGIASSGLDDFTIRAEINGKVYSINKVLGETVNTQTPVAIIGNDHQFYVELQVDEFDIAKIQKGQRVFIGMDSYKGQSYEAIVDKVYPLMNPQSKTFKVDAVFVNQPQQLFPNLSAEANIVIAVKEKAMTIPRSYLIDNEYVYLSNKEKRKVKLGLMDYEKVEILSGISSSDALIKN
ncbi:MAG: hypothetical protein RLZ56_447 [Bacteroidota bacterium]|jgi:multidrug efflux pump subunit AcrA (membrane-fusion protein)